MDIIEVLAQELSIRPAQAQAAVQLIDEGNTIPFIARYRKEVTGSLNDEVLRNLSERLTYLRNLTQRKEAVLAAIGEQGKLTVQLRAAIDAAQTLVAVEDLYRPYRPKRRTRATIAKEKGLKPLAAAILAQKDGGTPQELAAAYVSEDMCSTVTEALEGASDIIAENISDEPRYRTRIRQMTMAEGLLVSEAKDGKTPSVYETYYHFSEPVSHIAGHRVLAVNRGEKERVLTVRIEAPQEKILHWLQLQICMTQEPQTTAFLADTIADSYRRLIAPAIEREIRNDLTQQAQESAMQVFGKNLTQLLMQPPVSGRTVLGWDPAFRTGCKLAVVDPTGKVLDTTVIYPTQPQNKVRESKEVLKKLIRRYHITLISLGNGTASRESEQVIVELIREIEEPLEYVIVNEAGASVYSASRLATEEFPQFDVGQRSAASIARRLQDPLAELVKIDPKAIGIGQYQHDMNQKRLDETLAGVVEDCVNRVGVDLNTASASLLGYISGITKTIAENIVTYREANGSFDNRRQLLKVPKLGPKAYEQCAGFLRITGGSEPLDATSVHPESYPAAKALLKRAGLSTADIATAKTALLCRQIRTDAARTAVLAQELGIGEITLRDIAVELEKPARDPRDEMPRPLLRADVLEMKDLKPGMILKGTVRNVVDFGVFVDIGVHQDGLVHISRLSDRKFIRHPLEVVSVGDVVDVQVLDVDLQRKRIALTMKIKEKK